jgi:DNA-binding transcriptional MerR regulator
MFQVGDFSKIAQVSRRLLRYYDQIGLLKPVKVDPQTGYRYYSADQFPQLNQILALRDLGLTLEQIGAMLDKRVTPEDIRGMFLLRKAEIEQTLHAEQQRLRAIESRIQRLDGLPRTGESDVIVKTAPSQRYLAIREVFPSLAAVRTTVREIHATVAQRSKELLPGPLVIVIHTDAYEPDHLDCEIGHVVQKVGSAPITLSAERQLTLGELPAAPAMATSVHIGLLENKDLAYHTLGRWLEGSPYQMSGPSREVFLQLPDFPPGADRAAENAVDAVVEVQIPIEPRDDTEAPA